MNAEPRLGARFAADGFLVFPGFLAAEAIAALRARAAEIVEAFDPTEAAGIFSTDDASRSDDAYFLGSGYAIRCFFEAEAFDAAGKLRVPKARAINKIGHALHDLDPVFERFSHDLRLDVLARVLGCAEPRVYQSMVIFKQPHIGGEVDWHQDATYLATEPESVLAFWFALEDADHNNGCLWVQRGGHRGPLRRRFVVDGGRARHELLDAAPWPQLAAAEPVEVAAGTLVVMHGVLPHYSAPNRSPDSRLAYTLHAVDAAAGYSPRNWLQRPADAPARGF